MSRVLASLFFLLSEAVSNSNIASITSSCLPPSPFHHPPQHRSAETLGRSVTSLALSAKRGKKKKKNFYKIEGLLQIWPWLWLGWGLASNKSFISFTAGWEWVAATGNKANVHMQNNQLSADFFWQKDIRSCFTSRTPFLALITPKTAVVPPRQHLFCSRWISSTKSRSILFIKLYDAGSFVFTHKKKCH